MSGDDQSETPIRVLLADDHPPTRAGVRYTLEQAGMVVVAEVADAAGAIEAAIREKPDLCLLDVHMPGSGIAATRAITDALPDTFVVILTVSRDDSDLFDALRAGASGYLLKDMDPDRIPNALLGVLAGEAALPRTLLIKVMDEFRERGRRRRLPLAGRKAADLTEREWEVLHLLRDGASTAEIAARLFVSQATVRSHVAAVLKKLKVPDRQAAIELLGDS
ncbi:MAG TPA: response regulator transcription factor [Acidimicrobiales bacterium]|nr:response regulator transcription factor [Acidimicrobiales bacterium]